MKYSGKLELTWVNKNKELNIEPRILVEDKTKSYGDPHSGNMLIHGDNLVALKALEKDFAGKIKCVCIDPPYNTGSAFDKYDDGVEQSIWLTLMYNRLKMLYTLLREDGVIFISIDDHEVAYLTVLLDEIFGRNNFIANLATIMNLKGNQDQFGFAGSHEYTLVYAKNKELVKLNKYDVDEETLMNEWKEDSIGLFKKGATLRATGEESNREDRPKMFYPILFKDGKVCSITEEEHKGIYCIETNEFNDAFLDELVDKYSKNGYEVILPKNQDGSYGRWRWGFETFYNAFETEIIVIDGRDGKSVYKKQRPELGDLPTQKPKSVFYKPEYSSGNGTAQMKSIFGYNAFPYPKPENLIADFLTIATDEGDYVLDSFLGSGTTAAVAQKMNRKWIGIELGDHAYTHCKARLDKVINGDERSGVTKLFKWQGGGGYKFFELAEPLLVKNPIIPVFEVNPSYTFEMVCEAICKIESFTYSPADFYHGYSSENRFIHITLEYVNGEYVLELASKLTDKQSLIIYCLKHQRDIVLPDNVEIKRIPKDIQTKFSFERKDDWYE